MTLIFGMYAIKVSLALWLKKTNKNESQQSYHNKKKSQAPIANMIKGLNFMFLFEK